MLNKDFVRNLTILKNSKTFLNGKFCVPQRFLKNTGAGVATVSQSAYGVVASKESKAFTIIVICLLDFKVIL